MNRLIRIVFALLLLTLIAINNSFAGAAVIRPVDHLSGKFVYTVQKLDSFLSSTVSINAAGPVSRESASSPALSGENEAAGKDNAAETFSRGRICSCQILNLESANYNHRHIALFAEKTKHGTSADFHAAKSRINREKKHLKQMFYDKVEVVKEVESEGSCHSLYVRMKSKDARLQIYEILNADIR
jgi:hypothetical protein